MRSKAFDLMKKYKHGAFVLYYLVILVQFQYLEKINAHVSIWMKSPLDSCIPFLSAFAIPYIAWFWYIAAALAILCFKDKDTFIRLCTALYVGMTICFIIYYLVPNGQQLRVPLTSHESNIFDRMVYNIYANDTPTNSAPSIHVMNSLATNFAILYSPYFKDKKVVRFFSQALNILIICSTMFIKQHSVIDVVLGMILAFILNMAIYQLSWKRSVSKEEVTQVII